MARRPFRRGVVRAQRRLTTWIQSADQTFFNNATGAKTINQSFAMDGSVLAPDATFVRVRGVLTIAPQTAAADLDFAGALGFGIVSDQAFGIGITAVPGPVTDASWDGWFVWMPFSYRLEVVGAPTDTLILLKDFIIDSKAMRKIHGNETLVVMTESVSGAFTASVQFRMLAKLA